MNGRWAMAAVAGILGQELLGVSSTWFEAGGKDYWMPNNALTAIEFLVIGHLELKRYEGWTKYKTVRPAEWYPCSDMSTLDSGSTATSTYHASISFEWFPVHELQPRNRSNPLQGSSFPCETVRA